MFVNVNKVGKFSCPTFIMHGSVDEVIAQEHGKELYENLAKIYQYTPCWIDGANHHDIIDKLGIELYMKQLNDFIKYCQQFIHGKKLKEDENNLTVSLKENVETKVDKEKPMCVIQVQLLDGKKIKGQFNFTQTIGDVYSWVGESSGIKEKDFVLTNSVSNMSTISSFSSSSSFTHHTLDDLSETIKHSDVGGSSLIQKKK